MRAVLSKQQRGRWYRKTKLTIIHRSCARYNYRKVARRCLGMWQRAGLIWIDPRQRNSSYLDSLLHEMLHEFAPDWSENRVRRTANKIAKQLWRLGVRPTVKR